MELGYHGEMASLTGYPGAMPGLRGSLVLAWAPLTPLVLQARPTECGSYVHRLNATRPVQAYTHRL